MTNVYSIGSGRQNKMFCLYITFTEYRSYGCFEKTHHVANLSTDYKKAVAKAKSIFEEYKDNSKLVIKEEWELNEIKRDGTSEQKNTYTSERCPYVAEKETQIFPLSKKVGAKGDKVQLNLGVTDAFSFRSRFGSSRCVKFVDANHNQYITFSTSNFAYSLDEGDTVLCEAEIGGYKKDYTEDLREYFVTTLKRVKVAKQVKEAS